MPFISPKKFLGQNFLRDENIARNIIASINPAMNDILVEIGPGHGVLTKYLYNRVRNFIAFEIDDRVIEELRENFSSENAGFILQDFLQADLKGLSGTYSAPLRIVGNIPYNITTPILFKLFDEEKNTIRDATLMMQLDVARRLVAKPRKKSYGILAVFTQHYCNVELLFSVSPNCFYPKPTVTSGVVRLEFKQENKTVLDEKIFRLTVRTAFGKRRKILSNALKYFPMDETLIKEYLANTSIPLNVRPEELTILDFIALSNDIAQFIKEKAPVSAL